MPCTGRCCVAFPLNKPLADIAAHPERFGDGEDAQTIVDMVTPITVGDAVERALRLYPDTTFVPSEESGPYYTCRHWDETTRLCTNYENRPRMCRDYPGYGDGDRCEHGCDCTDRRET